MAMLPIERRAKFPEGKKMTVEEVAEVVGPEFAEMNEDPPESVKKVREDMEESMEDYEWGQGHDIRSRLAHDLLPVERVASFPGKKRPGRGPAQGPDGFYMDVYEGPHVGWEPVNSMVDSRHPEMGYAPMPKQEVMRYTRGNKPWRVEEAKGGRVVAIWESEMGEGDADHDAWLARTPRAASEQQAEKLEAEAEANEAQADADREKADAARMKEGAGGLYGYTKGTQRDVEASIRKAQRRVASVAKTLYATDERSVDFLKAHAKRANSKTARLILSAMKSLGPRVASAKTAGSGAANARYLASLDDRTELKILAAVAKHYGVTTSEIKDELIDRDAEALYEYLAFDRGMAMKVYRDFQSGRFASTKTSGLGIEAVKPDLFYVSTEDGDTYGPYRSKAEAGDASDDYYAATERESSPESGDRVLKSIINPRRFVLNTPAELKRMSRMASAMLPVEKAAAKKTKAPVQEKVAGGLYGYPTKTARLALVACSDLRAYVGEVAYGLHSRRTAKYDRITGFLKEHGKTAKCAYSRMILSCYPDAPVAKAASAKSTDFKKGDRVMYWVHGKGTVTDLWNKGGKTGLTVEWDSGDVSHPMDRSRVMSDLQKVAAMPSQSVGAFVAKVDAARADAGLSMSDEEAKDKYPWDDCIADQMKQYGDKATAEKVCGKIKAQSQGKSAAAKITDREYDALRPGQRIFMGVSGGFMQSGEKEFEVGRTSYSKKYDVYSKTLYPVEDGVPVKKGRAKWTLFKRPTGVSLGHGGMGTVIKSFRTASQGKTAADKKKVAPHMYVISKQGDRFMITRGDPKRGGSKMVFRSDDDRDVRDWLDDNKRKISKDHMIDLTGKFGIPAEYSDFYMKVQGKKASDQMLRKAFVPDSVDGWLEWEDGTRTAASKTAMRQSEIEEELMEMLIGDTRVIPGPKRKAFTVWSQYFDVDPKQIELALASLVQQGRLEKTRRGWERVEPEGSGYRRRA